MAVLLDLPQELLVRVASYLTTAELGPLRRTCKHIEKGLFKTFAKEFFTKRQFMLEHVSLQALVDIAGHETLAPYLKEIIISTHHIDYDQDNLSDKSRRYREAGYLERDVFIGTGQAQTMLAEAFSKLPNLNVVGLRDYDGSGRFRDGENGRWRSYGWSFDEWAFDNVHAAWRSGTLQLSKPGPIFGSLLFALGQTQSRIDSVEVFLRKHHQLTPASFDILQGPMGAAINPVLGGLKTLMLAIRMVNVHGTEFGVPWSHYDEANDLTTKPLKNFLRQTSNLTTLRLNFDPLQFFGQRLLDWLGRSAGLTVYAALVPTVDLAALTCLDLGMVIIKPDTLVRVIAKFTGLRSISLWKVSLIEFAPPTDTNQMADFLSELADTLPATCNIANMLIGFATQSNVENAIPGAHGVLHPTRPIYFDAEGNSNKRPGLRRADQISYKAHFGSDFRQWLQDKAATAHVLVPVEISSSDDEESNEEDHIIEIDDDEEDESESESDT